jgi:hypothetical protein
MRSLPKLSVLPADYGDVAVLVYVHHAAVVVLVTVDSPCLGDE